MEMPEMRDSLQIKQAFGKESLRGMRAGCKAAMDREMNSHY